jgi:SAM-dependent methyltransferase
MEISNNEGSQVMRDCPIGCPTVPVETGVYLAIGQLLQCPECGHQINNVSASEYEASLQKWNTANGTLPDPRDAQRYRQVISRRLATAKRILGRDGPFSLLDVGCSSGALLRVASDLAFDVAGVEPATDACNTARASGFKVFNGYLKEASFPAASFDVITLFELIEHITDPLALLEECGRILKPNGVIIINTPNAASLTAWFMKNRWEGFDLVRMGGHISFFTPGSMALLGERTGLQVTRMEARNVRFYEKGQCSPATYRVGRLLSQLLAYPVKLAGRGHDLLVYMTKA